MKYRELQSEYSAASKLNIRLASLLRGVANGLKGPPPELASWSFHDLPKIAREMRLQLDMAAPVMLKDRKPAHRQIVLLWCDDLKCWATVRFQIEGKYNPDYWWFTEGMPLTCKPRHVWCRCPAPISEQTGAEFEEK